MRAIIDFAAEDDVDGGTGGGSDGGGASGSSAASSGEAAAAADGDRAARAAAAAAAATDALARASGVVGRVYRYEDEAACDRHVAIFRRAIEAAASLPGPGFAAVKVTALGNPLLLERMSAALAQVRSLFAAGDADGDKAVDAREFEALFKRLLPRASADDVERAWTRVLGGGGASGKVDVIDWTQRIQLKHFPAMAEAVRAQQAQQQGGALAGGAEGSAAAAAAEGAAGGGSPLAREYAARALSEGEVALADALLARVHELAALAGERGVRLMIDAEHTYFQGVRGCTEGLEGGC